MKWWHWLSVAIAGIVILAIPAYRYWVRVDRGDTAPSFSLPDLEGHDVSLAEIPGKVVLIHFWATWCEPCRQEIPSLESFSQTFRDKGLSVVAIAEDQDDAEEAVRRFRILIPFTFPVLLDRQGKVADRYQAWGVPESIFVNHQGMIMGRVAGPQVWDAPASLATFEAMLRKEEVDGQDRRSTRE